MSVAEHIKQYLANIPAGEPFLSKELRQFGTTENVRKILNRMVKAGELKRAARGIFIKSLSTNPYFLVTRLKIKTAAAMLSNAS